MSEFFQHYPQIRYDISGLKPPKYKTVINIMAKAKIKSMLTGDIVNYFPYSIPESERPDITAYKAYGNVKYTWLIFLINDITDPIFDWPLNSREFGAYIKNKYGTLQEAKNGVHHYEKIVRTRIEATGVSEAIPEATIEVDETTYDGLDENDRKIIYCYDWEVDRNEAKRDIKLIDRKYVQDILSEHAEKLG
tara:strand:+ start:446 stop:1021 length:576 start_codon:yes stop_codon:yes gene_type:complete